MEIEVWNENNDDNGIGDSENRNNGNGIMEIEVQNENNGDNRIGDGVN